MAEVRYPFQALLRFATESYECVGVPAEDARLIADTLVRTDLRGHPSHGIFRLPWYVHRIQRGVMRPVTELETVSDRGVVTVLDAHDGVGQLVADRAMRQAVDRSKETGAAVVAVRNSNHFGAAMSFTLEAAHAGCVGIITTNASPAMAPWGGKQAVIGNNPWSIATPAGRYAPLILDIANTVVARGKIYNALQSDEAIPLGWAMDADGHPTTDPVAALGGLILPMGGHKGYVISFMMDVLSGVLTGSRFAADVFGPYQAEKRSGCGHLLIALDIAHFIEPEEFERRVEQLIDEVKATSLAPGYDEIFYPGELEARNEAANLASGVPLPHKTVRDLVELASEIGVQHPF